MSRYAAAKKLIIGELVLLLASVLIFRSLWIILDQYVGSSNLAVLIILLAVGLIVSVLALIWINREVNGK